MSFNDSEISNHDGRRIGLYHFRWGQQHWYYTSADKSIFFDDGVAWPGQPAGDKEYLPITISDSGVQIGGTDGYDFEVTVPRNNEVAQLFRVTPPSGRVYLKVRRMHDGEDDAPLFWSGTVGNVRPKSKAGAQIVCRSSMMGLKRTGLRLTIQRQCPHSLYDRQCQVPQEDHAYPYVIDEITANVVTLVTSGADQVAGFFDGGIVAWEVEPGTIDQRMIETHTAPLVFTIFGRGDGLEVGMAITLYPGCDRTTGPNGCARFANIDNFGGHEYLPGKSPFDGTPVF